MIDRVKSRLIALAVLFAFGAIALLVLGTPIHPAAGPQIVCDHHTGYSADPQATAELLGSLAKPTLAAASPHLLEADKDADVFLYRALAKQHRRVYGQEWVVGRQGIGDCVSWGWAHAIAIVLAIDAELGESRKFEWPATEAIYGGARIEGTGKPGDGKYAYRPYNPNLNSDAGDGASGAGAARFVTSYGVLFRTQYPFADLTTYDRARARAWGAFGCGGRNDEGRADSQARAHPVKQVALVKTWEEAAAAIRSGYPIAVCSSVGFDGLMNSKPKRDAQGFLAARGSWGHCMVFIGVRAKPPGLLCLNSWGPDWVEGPKYPDDQPDGSFWVARSTVEQMLRFDGHPDSFAIASVTGFPYRPLNHGDWVRVDRALHETHYALAP
jgi:hypothetical protein